MKHLGRIFISFIFFTAITVFVFASSVTVCADISYSYYDQENGCRCTVSYTVSNGEVEITDFQTTATDGKIILPSKIDGIPVTSLASYAFYGRTDLTEVIIPEGVTKIGSVVFGYCSNLQTVSIPDSVVEIDASTFSNCNKLNYKEYGNAKYLGNADNPYAVLMFPSTGATECTIHPDAKVICESAFQRCFTLQTVVISDSVKVIGQYAFSDCSKLQSVTMGKSVSYIGKDAFNNCRKLSDLYITDPNAWCRVVFDNTYAIPGGVKHFLDEQGNELTEIVLNDTVTNIPDYAFASAKNLQSVTISSSVTSIGAYAFLNVPSLNEVHISNIGAWCQIAFGNFNANPLACGAKLYINDVLVTDVEIPDGVTQISAYAFYKYSNLQTISIPDSVITIGNNVFYGCTNLAYNIYDNGMYLGNASDPYSFLIDTCSDSLTECMIHDATRIICDSAFKNCKSLAHIAIPNNVIRIGQSAFYQCTGLTSVTIGNGLGLVDTSAFSGCTGLKNVYYAGSETQWNEISIAVDNAPLTDAAISYLHVHDYSLFTPVVTQPTCTENGYTEYTCVHGESFISNYVEPLGHTIVQKPKVEPTCTEEGSNADGTWCERCHEVFQVPTSISVLGHSFTNYISDGNATCLADGTETAKCDRCNITDTQTENSSALGHSFTNYVSNGNATCLEDGTETAKCDRCDITDTQTENGSALGHSFTNYISNGDATCVKDGTKTAKCDRCDHEDTQTDSNSKLGHSFTAYYSNDDATCLDDGTIAAKCDRCEQIDVQNDYGSALGHKFINYIKDGNATCLEDGTETAKCVRCEQTHSRQAVGAKLGHSFTSYKSNGDATCLDNGTETAKCDRCEEMNTRTDENSALGHSFTDYYSNGDSTCLVDGTETAKCDRCEETNSRTDVGSKLGHSFTKYLSDGNALCEKDGTETAQCDRCEETHTRTEENSATGHSYDFTVTGPTCTEQGYTIHTCHCGDTYKDSFVAALGHSFTNYISDNNATCVNDGTETAKCDRCDVKDVQMDVGSRLGHKFVNYVSDHNATCTKDGTKTAKCDRCSATITRTDVDSMLGHSFTNYVSNGDATCLENGTKTAQCDRCDATDTQTEHGSALGHSFTNYISNGDATCVVDGTETAKCDRCDATDTQTDIDSQLGHSFTNYVSNGDAACLVNGTETAKCDRCDTTDTQTEHGSALGHSFTNYISNGDATCVVDGTETAKCDRCNITDTRVDANSALGHSGDMWFEIIPATCTETGLKARICEVCGETESAELLAKGHSYRTVVTEPTCTEKGYTTGTCSACGHVYVANYVDATGHSFGSWIQTIAPSCTSDGLEERTCYCGEREVQSIAALGHKYSVVITAPTCTEKGYTTNTCTACGDVTITDYVDAKGHKWSAWIQTIAPNCTTEGARTHFCNCGTRETESVEKLAHEYQNGLCTGCGVLESYYWMLSADATANVVLEQDLYVDLNGYDLSGTIVTNGYEIYGMDSTTDSYSCEAIGYFNCVDENGNAIVPVTHFKSDINGSAKRYMTIKDENGYSFHRFYLGITHMNLRPGTTGVGYKAVFYGDEMVAANLDSFGFTMTLGDCAPKTAMKAAGSFISGKSVTLRIDNYDVEKYGETDLAACAVLKLADGTVIESAAVTMTFRGLMEQLDANYTALTAQQLNAVAEMIKKYAIIISWDLKNLFAE